MEVKRKTGMRNRFTQFMNDDSGTTATEYGLIVALISITIIVAASTIGLGIEARYQNLGDLIDAS